MLHAPRLQRLRPEELSHAIRCRACATAQPVRQAAINKFGISNSKIVECVNRYTSTSKYTAVYEETERARALEGIEGAGALGNDGHGQKSIMIQI